MSGYCPDCGNTQCICKDEVAALKKAASSQLQSTALLALLRDVANLGTGQDCDPAHHDLVLRAMDFLDSNT